MLKAPESSLQISYLILELPKLAFSLGHPKISIADSVVGIKKSSLCNSSYCLQLFSKQIQFVKSCLISVLKIVTDLEFILHNVKKSKTGFFFGNLDK